MIELPETYVLADQINRTLVGKKILNATANSSPHKFAWYTGDPADYHSKLSGRTVRSSNPGTGYTGGVNVEIVCDDMLLVLGTPIRYQQPGEKLPAKHQLMLEFEDESHMTCTVQMWGSMFCYPLSENGLPTGYKVKRAPTPYSDDFDLSYFRNLAEGCGNLSAKGFLATEQRIPGLGNGALQDILFNARIHPRRKMSTLSEAEFGELYRSVKDTLFGMMARGGRDTERDLFGCEGGYSTLLSSKTAGKPCTVCGGGIVREAYMGGNIYFCPVCQPIVTYTNP